MTDADNVHDTKLLTRTIDATVVEPPARAIQNLCLDKGYDNATGEAACQAAGHQP